MNRAQKRATFVVPAGFDMENSPTVRCEPIVPEVEVEERRTSVFARFLRFFGFAATLCVLTGGFSVGVTAETAAVGHVRCAR